MLEKILQTIANMVAGKVASLMKERYERLLDSVEEIAKSRQQQVELLLRQNSALQTENAAATAIRDKYEKKLEVLLDSLLQQSSGRGLRESEAQISDEQLEEAMMAIRGGRDGSLASTYSQFTDEIDAFFRDEGNARTGNGTDGIGIDGTGVTDGD